MAFRGKQLTPNQFNALRQHVLLKKQGDTTNTTAVSNWLVIRSRMQTLGSSLLHRITTKHKHSKLNVKKIRDKVGQINFTKLKCQLRESWITRSMLSKNTNVSPQLSNRLRLNNEILRLHFSESYSGKPLVFIYRLYLKRVEILQLRKGPIL